MARYAYIDGTNYDYMVSSDGDVISFKHKVAKILKPRMNNRGYLRVRLNNKEYLVHDLVAGAFLHKNPECTQVNHKDENKTNNSLSNLEWCTREYNIAYSKYRAGREAKPIAQYDMNGNLVTTYHCASEAVEKGFCQSGISSCCLGKLDSYKGYKWEYIDNDNEPERIIV